MISKKKAPRRETRKPRGEQLLDRIDQNPNDRDAWNELAGELPAKAAKKTAKNKKPASRRAR
jgi:hypothetical protein